MWTLLRGMVVCLALSACLELTQQVPCPTDGGVDPSVDAGFCVAEELGAQEYDAGEHGFPPEADAVACAALVASACGASNECARDPGCVAADLTSRFEPERCAEAAADARSYPPCQLGTCAILVDKVCGVADDVGARACAGAPGCVPALELATRADDGDVAADDSCAQALADEVLFPSCG